jgi:hypothetical protein
VRFSSTLLASGADFPSEWSAVCCHRVLAVRSPSCLGTSCLLHLSAGAVFGAHTGISQWIRSRINYCNRQVLLGSASFLATSSRGFLLNLLKSFPSSSSGRSLANRRPPQKFCYKPAGLVLQNRLKKSSSSLYQYPFLVCRWSLAHLKPSTTVLHSIAPFLVSRSHLKSTKNKPLGQ